MPNFKITARDPSGHEKHLTITAKDRYRAIVLAKEQGFLVLGLEEVVSTKTKSKNQPQKVSSWVLVIMLALGLYYGERALLSVDKKNEVIASAVQSVPRKAVVIDKIPEIAINTTNISSRSLIFSRPFQYIGMSAADVVNLIGGTLNKANNIVLDSAQSRMFMETELGIVTFVQVELKETVCRQSVEFDPERVLEALHIDLSELVFSRKRTYSHVYNNHEHKVQVMVLCQDNDVPLSVGFSRTYYMT